jgi:glycosyltransferase involved in cell wall biosynthesis
VIADPSPARPLPAPSGRRVVVVPCFNEAKRLDGDALLALLDDGRTDVVFVDDGSTDATRAVLQALVRDRGPRARVVALDENGGKGEAVRRGLLAAVDDGAPVVAFLDADLSTPVTEMRRVLAALDDRDDVHVAMGARVALLGRAIERSPARHYLGRVFATAASTMLGVRVYDTQCGAKAFRVSAALRDAVATPFSSRWAFDVELLARLLEAGVPADAFFELPLDRWRDVGGSKLTLPSMVKAGVDVARIAARRRR